ncbi:hypothetical protein LTR35_017721 [Friedmanniomyces endolithicus]|nr:hypothetical protein LTR35_017721 [Friedmanniomyces endolithicus]KAK0268431.1 hypothetical protein LTS00_017569 [Friedmanniomyces endolithicus]
MTTLKPISLALLLIFTFGLLFRLKTTLSYREIGRAWCSVDMLLPQHQPFQRDFTAGNSTLGFGTILALSQGTQWRIDGMRAAAHVSGIELQVPAQPGWPKQFIQAFRESGPIEAHGAAVGWLGHMELLKLVLQSGCSSGLILKDDMDWDTEIRNQTRLIAAAVRALTNEEDNGQAPYGSGWDVLWMGHCDIGLVMETIEWAPYTKIDKQVPASPGMGSSMKGAAFVMPLRKKFVLEVLSTYEACTSSYDLLPYSWSPGSFTIRAFVRDHANVVKARDDQRCRQSARDVRNIFKKGVEAQSETASKVVEGGASVRGGKGAVLPYGNYDVCRRSLLRRMIKLMLTVCSNTKGLEDIFGVHHGRLAEIKRHYDPKDMFDKMFAIQPTARRAICKQQKIELSKI